MSLKTSRLPHLICCVMLTGRCRDCGTEFEAGATIGLSWSNFPKSEVVSLLDLAGRLCTRDTWREVVRIKFQRCEGSRAIFMALRFSAQRRDCVVAMQREMCLKALKTKIWISAAQAFRRP